MFSEANLYERQNMSLEKAVVSKWDELAIETRNS